MAAKTSSVPKRAGPFIRLVVMLSAGLIIAVGAVANQYLLNGVMRRRYVPISDQRPLGRLSKYSSDELRAYDRSPAEIAADKDVNVRDVFLFFARTGQRKKAVQTAHAIADAQREGYAGTLYNVVAYFVEIGDLADARTEAQRFVNYIAKLGPNDEVFELNRRLDSCRKLIRLLNLHYPLSDPAIVENIMEPGAFATDKDYQFAHDTSDDDMDEAEDEAERPRPLPADLKDYGDYYEVAAKASAAGPGAVARDLWAAFAAEHSASELREDAEINILSIRVHEARHGDAFVDRAREVIRDGFTFADAHDSALTDDALLYALRASASLGERENAWMAFQRLNAMPRGADSPLKMRYLITHSQYTPDNTREEDRALIDAFMLRASYSDTATANDVAHVTADPQKTIALVAIAAGIPREWIPTQAASEVAKSVLCRTVRWESPSE